MLYTPYVLLQMMQYLACDAPILPIENSCGIVHVICVYDILPAAISATHELGAHGTAMTVAPPKLICMLARLWPTACVVVWYIQTATRASVPSASTKPIINDQDIKTSRRRHRCHRLSLCYPSLLTQHFFSRAVGRCIHGQRRGSVDIVSPFR